jgi:AAA+ superfamily predicted ATPase
MERSADNKILISEIAESIKCSKIRIIKYINECEELEKKKLIRCCRSESGISFRVPRDVRDSLRKCNEFKPEKNDNLTIFKFFTVLEQLFSDRQNDELTYDSLKMEVLDLINLNMHLHFCKKIMSYNLSENDLVLLTFFCLLFGSNNDDNIGFHDLEFLFDDKSNANSIKKSLSEGSHNLIEGKFIVYTNNDGFVNSEAWKVSDMAKKDLLCELSGSIEKKYQKNLILHNSIRSKTLFYNEGETKSIQKLIFLLKEENYNRVQERLYDNGMRKGFACLFSGAPGTGKTDTAYQIARETGRNIMMVDISDTKSCWFGESEKKIKEIFNNYLYAVANSEIAPILLLNEADAVIEKRKEFDSASRAVDQAENAIQNIILQELENLSGILIATTNLTKNMDKAFERRFLYKIEFMKPCLAARQSIWQSMMPSISAAEAETLASRFDLSGGQIENITRKAEIDVIINGGGLAIDVLQQYCKDEIQNGFNNSKSIGFAS